MAWSSSRCFVSSPLDQMMVEWYATATPEQIAQYEQRQHELAVARASAPKVTVQQQTVRSGATGYEWLPLAGAAIGAAAIIASAT